MEKKLEKGKAVEDWGRKWNWRRRAVEGLMERKG